MCNHTIQHTQVLATLRLNTWLKYIISDKIVYRNCHFFQQDPEAIIKTEKYQFNSRKKLKTQKLKYFGKMKTMFTKSRPKKPVIQPCTFLTCMSVESFQCYATIPRSMRWWSLRVGSLGRSARTSWSVTSPSPPPPSNRPTSSGSTSTTRGPRKWRARGTSWQPFTQVC